MYIYIKLKSCLYLFEKAVISSSDYVMIPFIIRVILPFKIFIILKSFLVQQIKASLLGSYSTLIGTAYTSESV